MTMDTLVLLCSCGCDTGLVFRADEEDMYISLINGYFGERQKPLLTFLSEKFRFLFRKNKFVAELMVHRTDLDNLMKFLSTHSLSETNRKPVNYAHLELEDMFSEESKDDLYSLTLMCDMSKTMLLRNKLYKMGELVYTETQRTELINQLQDILSHKQTTDMC